MARFMTRRELLRLAASAPMVALAPRQPVAPSRAGRLDLEAFSRAPWRAIAADESPAPETVKLTRTWDGAWCRSQISNQGPRQVALKSVVLFDIAHDLPPATPIYGEGFQMLSQTGGTLGQPIDLGNYTDAKHYKLPAAAGTKAFYGMMMLSPTTRDHHLFAFTSCRRYVGQFYLNHPSLKVVVDTEGHELRPGEIGLVCAAGALAETCLDRSACRRDQCG